jgi:hypothetical protein
MLTTYRDVDDLDGYPRGRTDAAHGRHQSREPSTTMGHVHEAEALEDLREEVFSPSVASLRLTEGSAIWREPMAIIRQILCARRSRENRHM